MNEEYLFELDTIADSKSGVLQVSDFENSLKAAKGILNNIPIFIITNDDELKKAKTTRTTLNKITKAIDRKRIDTIEDFCLNFKNQCNSLKELFDEKSKEFSEEIKTYEEKKKTQKTIVSNDAKVYTATITFTDEKIVEKLKTFCERNNLTITIK